MVPLLSPSQFVAIFNQTLEMTLPVVEIEGEIVNYRVSRGKWIYFDISDTDTRLKCFGAVYNQSMPLEDGMKIKLVASPRLHKLYGLSLNIVSINLVGEGNIKKSADLLRQKLEKENLFTDDRKRPLLYPPERVGLVTSIESAAYRDFTKVLAERFGGIKLELVDVLVQGQEAPSQIVRAIDWFGSQTDPVDVLVIIRGGGSAEDLQAFNTEEVTRAVAGSRVPTLVAIGHESDILLAEMAADKRASTPSNAAELLVPDRKDIAKSLDKDLTNLFEASNAVSRQLKEELENEVAILHSLAADLLGDQKKLLADTLRTLGALSPDKILKQGYAVVTKEKNNIKSAKELGSGDVINIKFSDGTVKSRVE